MTNPVLTRELRTGLRGNRAFFLRTAFVTVLAIVVITAWMTALGNIAGTWRGATLDIRTIPGLGRTLFAALGATLLVLLLALLPGYAAGGISGERETRTLEILLCTWLRPRSIVLGKLAASTVFAIALILSSLPVVSAVFLLGGVSPLELALLFLILLATAVFVSALSLCVSSYCAKTYMAIMVTYLLLGVLHYAAPVGMRAGLWCVGAAEQRSPSPSSIRRVAVETSPLLSELASPLSAARSLFAGSTFGSPAEVYVDPAVTSPTGVGSLGAESEFALFYCVSPALMLLGTIMLVGITSRAVARSTHVIGPPLSQRIARRITARARTAHQPAAAATDARSAPSRRARGRPSPWAPLADRVRNPVLARELRGRPLGNEDMVARAAVYGFILVELVMLIGVGSFMYSDFVAKAMAAVVAMCAFLAAIPAAMSIAAEKEQRTLEMVVATPLRPRTILWGKLAAAFWQAQPVILLGVPVGVLSAAMDIVPWLSALHMWVFAESFALATCAIGVLVSLLAPRPARAVAVTASVIAVIIFGPLLLQRLGIIAHPGPGPGMGVKWIGGGPLAIMSEVLLAGDLIPIAATLVLSALAVALLAFLAALALFRRTTQRLIESA